VKKLYIGLALLLIVALFFTGCGKASTSTTSTTAATSTSTTSKPTTTTQAPTNTPQQGGTLRLIDDRPPSGAIGWFAEPGPPAGSYYFPMFEGLARAQYDGSIKPSLASSWEFASDLTSATFHLQKNVKFHDGSSFNAAVAKWNLDQYMAAHMPAVKDVKSVEAVDDSTLKVNLTTYHNTLLYDVGAIPMVSKTAFDAKGGKEGLRWNPVGTGPFKFDNYVQDTSITCSRFKDYWQTGKPYLDSVVVTWVPDPMTSSSSLQAGEADAMVGNSPLIFNDLKQQGFTIISGFTGAITLIPDSKNANSPLANIKVRQAIDYAINRDALVKAKGYGMWATTYQFADPNSSAYIKDIAARTYNPDKAKQLLAEAGYASGLTLTLYGDSSTTDKDTTVAIQGYLSEVGITAQLSWLDYMGFVQYVMKGWENGLLVCANGFAPNMNSACNMVWAQTAMFFPSVAKSNALQQLLDASTSTKDYDPTLVKKYIQNMYDDVMFNPVYCIIRGVATTSKVHDTGFLKGYGPSTWDPGSAWISK
jgi:peptide/nickel transport system substrate-binding protein